jgi:mannose-1-phosphate guanylyltransferase
MGVITEPLRGLNLELRTRNLELRMKTPLLARAEQLGNRPAPRHRAPVNSAPRTAFVLGAGLGTRLRPLTNRRPKPLIPVANRPLITHAFDHLIAAGVERFVVNTHWCAERYAEFLPDGKWRGKPVTFVHESPEVLETAGGIWNARTHLGDGPFIVYNGDILSDFPLAPALNAHRAAGNEVTLILRSHGGNTNVAFDTASGRILDLRRALRPEFEPRHLFTGIYIVEPEFIARIPAAQKLSVVPVFHDMIRAGANLGGIVLDDGAWWDLGSRSEYLAVHAALAARVTEHAPWISPYAGISADAKITGATAVAAGAEVGSAVMLHDCIVWQNATVAAGARLTRCIVADGATARGEHADVDFVAG